MRSSSVGEARSYEHHVDHSIRAAAYASKSTASTPPDNQTIVEVAKAAIVKAVERAKVIVAGASAFIDSVQSRVFSTAAGGEGAKAAEVENGRP